MMKSAGVSGRMAMLHIEMPTDFTPVDLKRQCIVEREHVWSV